MNFDNDVLVNFRDENGNHSNENLRCSYCDSQAEVFAVTMEDDEGFIIACKGCLTKMIEAIDNAYIKHMKKGRH
jgi:hypothetical protein